MRRILVAVCMASVLAAGCGDDKKEPGTEGGPCLAGDECNTGLECQAGTCVKPETCTPDDTRDCTCDGGADGTRTCGADERWSDCTCGTCGDGTCDPGEDHTTCPDDCDAPVCSIEIGVARCDTCIQEKCFDACAACTAEPACVSLQGCLDDCTPADPQCNTRCRNNHADGATLFDAFLGPGGCVSQQCQDDCGSICGDGTCDPGETPATCPDDCPDDCGNGTCDLGETEVNCPEDCSSVKECELRFGVADCDTCVDTHCLDDCNACARNDDCSNLFTCYSECRANPTCIQGCDGQYPGGKRLLDDFAGPNGCISDHCSRDCS